MASCFWSHCNVLELTVLECSSPTLPASVWEEAGGEPSDVERLSGAPTLAYLWEAEVDAANRGVLVVGQVTRDLHVPCDEWSLSEQPFVSEPWDAPAYKTLLYVGTKDCEQLGSRDRLVVFIQPNCCDVVPARDFNCLSGIPDATPLPDFLVALIGNLRDPQ